MNRRALNCARGHSFSVDVDALQGATAVGCQGAADCSELVVVDRAAYDAERAANEAANTNDATLRGRVDARLAELLVGADALEAGTLTAVEQRRLLALAIRTLVRLARLYLRRLDQAP